MLTGLDGDVSLEDINIPMTQDFQSNEYAHTEVEVVEVQSHVGAGCPRATRPDQKRQKNFNTED